MFSECFVVGNFDPMMQNLMNQSEYFSCVSGNGQNVLADVTATFSFADLAQVIGQ